MKFCPNCQSQYTDETLKFCLQDGTPLQDALFTQLPSEESDEAETVVSNRPSQQAYVPRQTSPPGWQTEQIPARSKKSSTTSTVFLTIFAMLLFFGLAGLGAWFYFNGSGSDKNANSILANKAPESNKTAGNTRADAAKATPSPSVAPSVSPNTEASPAEMDREQIRKDVSSRISTWNEQGEALDFDAYMNNYAERVDYYRQKGASLDFVRADKQRAFAKFDSIKTEISNLTVTPDASGARATAVFDKKWNFEGDDNYSSGKVRQQLQLRKIDGQWLITGERDLKVYYME